MEKNGRIFKSLVSNKKDQDMTGGGTCTQLSWGTIKPYLEQACALHGNEILVGIVVDEQGITFKLEMKK